MIQFIFVLIIVGAVSGYFFGVDTALWAGKRTVEFWILAGVIITILGPLLNLFRFVTSVAQKVYHFLCIRKG